MFLPVGKARTLVRLQMLTTHPEIFAVSSLRNRLLRIFRREF
jgi:hypothetical protein